MCVLNLALLQKQSVAEASCCLLQANIQGFPGVTVLRQNLEEEMRILTDALGDGGQREVFSLDNGDTCVVH